MARPGARAKPTPTLSHDALSGVLRSAYKVAGIKHHRRLRLVEALRSNIQYAMEDCDKAERDAQSILNGFVRSERIIIEAWNKHRLGENTDIKNVFSAMNVEDDVSAENALNLPLFATAELSGAKFSSSTATQKISKPRSAANAQRLDYYSLSLAPSQDLPFPTGKANITIAEIICFFPKWLRSVDVIDRAFNNGAAGAMRNMIESYREMGDHVPEDIVIYAYDRTIKRMMRYYMCRRPGFETWCPSRHVTPPSHDPTSVSVAGFRTTKQVDPEDSNQQKLASVQFKDLANGVKKFPWGGDALDLTRCILYHRQEQHQDEDWKFPDDFDRLVLVLGGPTVVTSQHHDGAVFSRWNYKYIEKITATEKAEKRVKARKRKDSKAYGLALARLSDMIGFQEKAVEAGPQQNKRKRSAISPDSDSDSDVVPVRKIARAKRYNTGMPREDTPVETDSDADVDAFKGLKFKRTEDLRQSTRIRNKKKVNYAAAQRI
ncbi:hypothetical protein P280DRAFT_484538 [Massarina eburnea CBS 473.64]|uniref:Uncharacterized protein n=1 Tax=Massarina eburnea CBS 473.64 TaxID=1395130 RepID=A0A6A6RJM5_9PLEO|nr:hypothetical protein P280DRAFT_484538 [Massarina eburnea CBS 473.64]